MCSGSLGRSASAHIRGLAHGISKACGSQLTHGTTYQRQKSRRKWKRVGASWVVSLVVEKVQHIIKLLWLRACPWSDSQDWQDRVQTHQAHWGNQLKLKVDRITNTLRHQDLAIGNLDNQFGLAGNAERGILHGKLPTTSRQRIPKI